MLPGCIQPDFSAFSIGTGLFLRNENLDKQTTKAQVPAADSSLLQR